MHNLPFGRPGRFYKGNLHGHSTQSDGAFSPAEVIDQYHGAGYDFLTLSDHFLEVYDWPVTDTRNLRRDDFTTIVGAELHLSKMLNGEIWHVLAIGLPPDFAAPAEGEDIVALSRRAADAGAFIGLTHPEWNGMTPEDANLIDVAHAVEIYNYGSDKENERGNGWALCEALLNQGRRLTAYATDDAHNMIHDAFGGWIQVRADSLDPDLILESLKAGHYYSSQGPEIHDVRVEGDEIVVACSPVALIIAQGRGSRVKYVKGGAMTEGRLPLDRFKDSFFRITVRDENGLKAWSNPVWLDS
jgi:predicted metal-dependent phosphoesterase TrpH